MQGKAPVFMNMRLGYAIDALSKSMLADILVDRARCEIGKGAEATDEEIAVVIERWLSPVAIARRERLTNLQSKLATFDKYTEKALDRKRREQSK